MDPERAEILRQLDDLVWSHIVATSSTEHLELLLFVALGLDQITRTERNRHEKV